MKSNHISSQITIYFSTIFLVANSIVLKSCVTGYRATGKDYPKKIYWRNSNISSDKLFDNAVSYLSDLQADIAQIDKSNKTIKVKHLEKIILAKKDSATTNNSFKHLLETTLIIVVQPAEKGSLIGSNLYVLVDKYNRKTKNIIDNERAIIEKLNKNLIDGIVDKK